MIEEGKTYNFLIVNTIVLPDDESYFILDGPDEKKYLLRKKYYEKYGFENNQVIKCHVDRINCQGKVFLEPAHPFYKVGKMYKFGLVKSRPVVRQGLITGYMYMVLDKSGRLLKIRNSLLIAAEGQKYVKGKITGIKKGKLSVSLEVDPNLLL